MKKPRHYRIKPVFESPERVARLMLEQHRLAVRMKLEELHALFSAEQPPVAMLELLNAVTAMLEQFRARENRDLDNLKNEVWWSPLKERIENLMDKPGEKPVVSGNGGTT